MDSERSKYAQLENFSVCQVCSRVSPRGSEGWLDAPLRQSGPHDGSRFSGSADPRQLRVVRCPQHWSEWALRCSVGRSKKWRQKMEEAKSMSVPAFPPATEPFPLIDEPLPDGKVKPWDA